MGRSIVVGIFAVLFIFFCSPVLGDDLVADTLSVNHIQDYNTSDNTVTVDSNLKLLSEHQLSAFSLNLTYGFNIGMGEVIDTMRQVSLNARFYTNGVNYQNSWIDIEKFGIRVTLWIRDLHLTSLSSADIKTEAISTTFRPLTDIWTNARCRINTTHQLCLVTIKSTGIIEISDQNGNSITASNFYMKAPAFSWFWHPPA